MTPTLGLLVGGPLLILTLAACAAVFLMARKQERGSAVRIGREDAMIVKWLAAGAFVVVAVIGLITLGPPFGPTWAQYHFWRPVSGEVQQVSNRLVSGGEGVVNQRFVVVIDGRPYAVDDTRAALVKRGDRVELRCKREYQWSAESGWACRWGS